MKYDIVKIIMKAAAYIYLFIAQAFIVFNFAYIIRFEGTYFGSHRLAVQTLVYVIAYIAINHLALGKLLSKKTLILIEALLLTTILSLLISNIAFIIYAKW